MTLAIEVRGLGKRYRRHAVASSWLSAGRDDWFWALQDVSFGVPVGEVLGVVGRNGAGKSTLLKVLAGITPPTTGEARVRGRLGSLLEVGTGFHPELSGRENIMLNGLLLGMSAREVRATQDEIIAFAELDAFIDTPVKYYSSGMYMRLAFAVPAHLDADLLLADEVLAVGDVQFQRKCLGKMQDVARSGRTVLFVSHNMGAVADLCTRALCLSQGRVVAEGTDVHAVIQAALGPVAGTPSAGCEWRAADPVEYANPYFRPTRLALEDGAGRVQFSVVGPEARLVLCLEGEVQTADPAFQLGFMLHAESGEMLFQSMHTDGAEGTWPALTPGRCTLRVRLPSGLLNAGSYRIDLVAARFHGEAVLGLGIPAPALRFGVEGISSPSPYSRQPRAGLLAPLLPWERV